MILCTQKEDNTKIEEQPPSKLTGSKQIDIALAKLGISPLIYKKKAINFDSKDLNKQSFSLKKQQGKIVFINFWATWCPPCVYEMPAMEKLHKEMKGKDFLMVAVSVDDNKKVISDFVKKHKLTFTIIHDIDKKILELYSTLGIYGFPTTFIIDKQGFIMAKIDGEREWDNQDSLNLFNNLIANKNNK
jgi:peroxiredoxin